jgi:hypothetical protein
VGAIQRYGEEMRGWILGGDPRERLTATTARRVASPAGRASFSAFPTPPPLVPSSGSLGSAASPGQLSLACPSPPGVCVYYRPPPSLSSELVATHGLLKKVSIGLMHRLVAFTDVSNARQLIVNFIGGWRCSAFLPVGAQGTYMPRAWALPWNYSLMSGVPAVTHGYGELA